MSGRIQIADSFVLLVVLAGFLDESGVGLLFLLAAAVHEGGHALAVKLCGGRVAALRLTALGGVMRYTLAKPGALREVAIAAAGPAAGLLAACGAAKGGLVLFAGANLLLSAINLLPVRPLDGGQIAAALLGDGRCLAWLEIAACTLASAGAAALLMGQGGCGPAVFCAALWWHLRKNLQTQGGWYKI